ncbi:uncharacterized protein [Asterias amurensis]|uniref:uncharacterized protein n=1 Tax=Asterias amurensis TaxID=7602 RepID=UPI003AB26FC3
MRLGCCHIKLWGRRNILLMSFWYFILMASCYMYYTYTEWRPSLKVYQTIINRQDSKVREPPGQVYLRNRDLSLRWQQAERLRILEENPRYTPDSVRHGADAVPPGSGAYNQQLLNSIVDSSRSNDNIPKKSNSASGSDAVANRTRNASSAHGTYSHRVTNEKRVVKEEHTALSEEEDEEEIEDEDDLRYPVTDTVDMTTIHFENATLKPPVPPIVDGYERIDSNESLRMRCSQCAVVSSSGHLINKTRGREIDSAQCVFRMNSSPTIGYEDDVGAKTTVRVIGHVNMMVLNTSRELQQEIFINQSSRPDKVIIPWLYSADKVDKATNVYYKIAQNFSKTFPNVEMYLLTPEKVKLADELFKVETGLTTKEANTWLSTGWMTLLFAIDVCDQIDIYGLAEENYCRDHPNDTTPYHYYDPDGKVECKYYQTSEERLTGGHLFITEKAVFARWAHKFNMSFHSPWWNITALAPNTTALETPFLKKFYEAKRNNRTIVRHRRVIKRVIKRVVVRRKVPVLKKSPKIKS